MMAMMNVLVRWYVKRFDKELDRIRYHSDQCQEKTKQRIEKSWLVKKLNLEGTSKKAIEINKDTPLTSYDNYLDKVKDLLSSSNKVEYFAQSSGTTSGLKKLIPTPESFVRMNHLRGSWYILNTLYTHRRDTNVFKYKNLLVGGAIYQRTKDFIIGDVSGIMLYRIPKFFRPFYVPTIAIATSPDWDSKLDKTAKAAIHEPEISLLAGVPTWVLALLRKVREYGQVNHVTELWPNLLAYIHGGVSIEPYKAQFKQIIDREDFLFLEVYNATEGYFAFQDDPDINAMLLMTDNGIYFEFIERDRYLAGHDQSDILPLHKIEVDTDYVMIVSTITGLIRYVQGDVVQFKSIKPYRLKVIGRVSEYINAFGEDLILNQAEGALLKVSRQHNAKIAHFTVGPKYITIADKGSHQWYVEFEREPADQHQFAQDLDQELRLANSNYDQKRSNDLALSPLELKMLPRGTFKRYLELKKKMGAQSKVQKLSNNRLIIEELENLVS